MQLSRSFFFIELYNKNAVNFNVLDKIRKFSSLVIINNCNYTGYLSKLKERNKIKSKILKRAKGWSYNRQFED